MMKSKSAVQYFSGSHVQTLDQSRRVGYGPEDPPRGGILIPDEPAAMEPIGNRIIEVPESVERTALHDSESGFVAYVPIGSIKKGEQLVTTGGDKVAGGKIVAGKTIRCAICHGADLKGLGNVPAYRGRLGELYRPAALRLPARHAHRA